MSSPSTTIITIRRFYWSALFSLRVSLLVECRIFFFSPIIIPVDSTFYVLFPFSRNSFSFPLKNSCYLPLLRYGITWISFFLFSSSSSFRNLLSKFKQCICMLWPKANLLSIFQFVSNFLWWLLLCGKFENNMNISKICWDICSAHQIWNWISYGDYASSRFQASREC